MPPTPSLEQPDTDLLAQLGGRAGIRTLVGALHFHTLRDHRLAPLFSGCRADNLVEQHSRLLIALILQPPTDALRFVQHSPASTRALNLWDSHLRTCMTDLGHAPETIDRLLDRLRAAQR